ncbi:selenocysteine-specific translation elongation factor [Campylobacter sp. MG1]|uniref:selenocysteine-specific translation elongation factor n=1 Tax=Campylobacter sp. MG1 TaxID=2976332 RepID=UPI00226D0126|nr:selenocysteine-specific translation elongation factor [Campylobacter sp. MG1]
MLIIQTAGHIDHGKTSVIKALNGFNGDNTPEELRRGITINLSFSNLDDISFVDVPGHESLLKTMINGVQSDYAMLVIDINEGIKEQTLEHIFILKIMRVKNIILVLNKIDLCDDLKKAKNDIINQLDFIPNRIFLVSAKTNEGIEELKEYLLNLPRPDYEVSSTRINIDRVFNVNGIGTVATGLLKSGILECKNLINENQQNILIKSIEVQHKNVDIIKAPARVAFVFKGELKKGDVLYSKGYLRTSKEIYATLVGCLKHDEKVVFCSGNKQIEAKFLEYQGFAKFELCKAAAFIFDEPYVILKNGRAVAGGRILNSITEPLKKAKMVELLKYLEQKNFKEVFKILNTNHSNGFGLFCAPQRFNLTTEQALDYAKEVGEIVDCNGACIYTAEALNKTIDKIKKLFFKNKFSLQSAKSLEKSLGTDEFLCDMALKNIEELEFNNGLYHLKGMQVDNILENNEDIIYKELNSLTPKAPYNIYDDLNLDRKSGDDILKKMCLANKVIRLSHNYFINKNILDEFVLEIKDELKSGIGVQELKNKYNLSRKYAIALLEYLDTLNYVKNINNKRYLK